MTDVDVTIPPETVPDVVRHSCQLLWEGNDIEAGIKGQEFADAHDAYEAGVNAAVTVWVRMIPGPRPDDGVHFAVEQLWTHQRFLLGHLMNATRVLEGVATKLEEFEATLEEYKPLLPKPGSLMARAGAWGARGNGR